MFWNTSPIFCIYIYIYIYILYIYIYIYIVILLLIKGSDIVFALYFICNIFTHLNKKSETDWLLINNLSCFKKVLLRDILISTFLSYEDELSKWNKLWSSKYASNYLSKKPIDIDDDDPIPISSSFVKIEKMWKPSRIQILKWFRVCRDQYQRYLEFHS